MAAGRRNDRCRLILMTSIAWFLFTSMLLVYLLDNGHRQLTVDSERRMALDVNVVITDPYK